MKKTGIILAAVMALALVSCNDVPEDVKSRAAEQNNDSVTQTVTDSEGNEKTAEKIGNITFACEPDPIEANEFYILRSPVKEKYDPEKDYSPYIQKMNKAAQTLFGFEIKEDEHFEYVYYKGEPLVSRNGEEIDYFIALGFMYANETSIAEIYDVGDTFAFYDLKDMRMMPWCGFNFREVYTSTNYPDTEYDMTDGTKMTVKQAIEQGEEIVKKINNLDLLDKEKSLELYRIAVRKTDADCFIDLFYRQKMFGLYVNYDGYDGGDYEDDYMRNSNFRIIFAGNNHAVDIGNYSSDFIAEKEKTELKIKTYDEAKQTIATKGLASNMALTVTEAGLRYCCVTKQINMTQEYRPMWVFVFDDPTETLSNGQADKIPDSYLKPYPRKCAFLDAVNGDIYYCDPFIKTFAHGKAE